MAYHSRDSLKRSILETYAVPSTHRYPSAAPSHCTPTASSSSSSPPASSPLRSYAFSHSSSELYLRTSGRSSETNSSPTLPSTSSMPAANWAAHNSRKHIDHEIACRQQLRGHDEHALDTRYTSIPRVSAPAEPMGRVDEYSQRPRYAPDADSMSSPPLHVLGRHYQFASPSASSSTFSPSKRKHWAMRNGSNFVYSDHEMPLTSDVDNDGLSSDGENGLELDRGRVSPPRRSSMHSHSYSHSYMRSHQSVEPPSSPSKSYEHRRTHSSPFTRPPRVSPFPQALSDSLLHRQQFSQAYSHSYTDPVSRFSPYSSSLPPAPPRTASSVASSSLLDQITDQEDDVDQFNRPLRRPSDGGTSQEVEADEEDIEPFAFSPVRRRISFSTSAERDTPLVPPMPVAPPGSLPNLTGMWASRKQDGQRAGKERERESRLVGREKRASEMLPTPPMSSPELEVAQPLPSSMDTRPENSRTPSQPMRREPSIPVGSLISSERATTPLRERRRRERPTLMDLLSSPQPYVSPNHPTTAPSSQAPASDSTRSGSSDPQPAERVPSPLSQAVTEELEEPAVQPRQRDNYSLPPSSPFSSPLSSPEKSVRVSASLPSSSPPARGRNASAAVETSISAEQAPDEEPSDKEDEDAAAALTSSPLSSLVSSPVKADHTRSPSVPRADDLARLQPLELSRNEIKQEDMKQQLPTPVTPEFAQNLLAGSDKVLELRAEVEASPADKAEDVPPVQPEVSARGTPTPAVERTASPFRGSRQPPVASPSTPHAELRTPLITTVQITMDMKSEEEDGDVDMDLHEMHEDLATPSSPLSEPPSPKAFDHSDVLPVLRRSSLRASDSEDDAAPPAKIPRKRKSPSVCEDVVRKRMRVASPSPAGEVDEGHVSDKELSEDGEERTTKPSRTKGSRARGKGRARARGRKKATLVPDASDEEAVPKASRPHLPTPSTTPDHDAEAETSSAKPRSRKQSKRRASSPPLSAAGSRPASPAREREHSKAASARRRSQQARQKLSPFVDWDEITPVPISELEGMIIETLATSRATSLSAAALWDALFRARPALKTTGRKAAQVLPRGEDQDTDDALEEQPDTSPLNKREWLQLLTYILTVGHLSSGVFGHVESSASDSDGPSSSKKKRVWGFPSKKSEILSTNQVYEIARSKSAQRAQWFYIPEKDADADRAALVKSMMRGPGKRSETMKYKRYYWKPLGKISRWDREDDL